MPSQAASEVNGFRTDAQFQDINRLAMDARGNLYVTESSTYRRIRFIDTNGYVSTLMKDDIIVPAGTTSPALSVPSLIAVSRSGPTKIRFQDTDAVIYDFSTGIIVTDRTAVVTTFAGSASGYSDGQGTAARFNSPGGITIDSAGNLYVADGGNYRIRKITPSGNVTTIAGSSGGYADGQGTAARFNGPYGITIDSLGNLYVADTVNNRIRKITSAGVVTTIAGSSGGYADGQGTDAQFNWPYGIAVDSSGNLYVADTNNNRIRKITPSGLVTTIAAQFNKPRGITIDSSGNLYVADSLNSVIRKITPSGLVTTIAGSGVGYADGIGGDARFNAPTGITIDSSGILYVVDQYNARLRKITPSGNVTTIAGSSTHGYADGIGGDAKFYYPMGTTIDSAGNLYVADTVNNRIRKITFIPP